MRLLIAEKPSVARSIAAVIGSGRSGDGFIECPDLVLTWAFGHLLSLDKPEDYKGGHLDMSDLPLIPETFRKSARDKDSAKQLGIVTKLIEKADLVIHAGDPDREGQLLIDEILDHSRWAGPTKRLWLSAVDPASIRKALDSLKNNDEMADLSASAECRSQADWLVGMNGSIALSRKIQAVGGNESLSLGRVQTPTLALIVRRDSEISGFSKRHHYLVSATVSPGIIAKWKMPDDLDGLSEDGLLLDKNVADQTASRITGKPAIVKNFSVKQGTRAAPLPHCLSSLQKAASARFGISAKDVLSAAQSLYENGVTTYPRTDCQYLPDEQFSSAGEVISQLASYGITGATQADVGLKHAAWDTKKVEAHHAIVPTGKPFSDDGGKTAKVYKLICEAFIRLFYPPESFETPEAVFDIDGLCFIAKSRTTITPGWTAIGSDDDDGAEPDITGQATAGSKVPDLIHGETRMCESGQVEAKETKPPRHYTDGTLIAAMTRVHSLIDDPKLKARLKETSGLGTEATRAGIIETLISRGYAERKGKDIKATDKGKSLISAIRQLYPAAADPGVTAIWEDALSSVATGKMTAADFMAAQQKQVEKLVSAIRDAAPIAGMTSVSKFKCPVCQSPLADRKSKKGFRFYACTSESCKAGFFREKDGKPGARLGQPGEAREARTGTGPACPTCKKPVLELKTKTGKPYFRCADHGAWWPGKDGKSFGTKWPDR